MRTDVALLIAAVIGALAVGWLIIWQRRPRHFRWTPRRHVAAAAFLREQSGELLRLPGRLRRLAADPRTPRRARWLLVALALYLATPIDLIPDFIPVLGQADDIAIAAVVLALAWRAIPADVWAEHFPPRAGAAGERRER